MTLSIRDLVEAVAQATHGKGKIAWDESKPGGTPSKERRVRHLESHSCQALILLAVGLSSKVGGYCNQSPVPSVRI